MYSKELSLEDALLFLENAPANIFFKDTECKYRFVSEICSEVHGGKEHSIIGKTDLEIHSSKELGELYYQDDLNILATGKGSSCVTPYPCGDEIRYFDIKKNPVYLHGKIIGIVGVINDVTKEKEQEKELEKLSFKDVLTGLYNRNYMEAHVKEHMNKEADFPFSVIMGDCNYLKRINDHLGHEYGDLLLKRVGRSIAKCVPKDCIAIRYGGDEFLIMCPSYGAHQVEALIGEMEETLQANSDHILPLRMAFGYYTIQDDSMSLEEVIGLADRNMYKNKKKMHGTRE